MSTWVVPETFHRRRLISRSDIATLEHSSSSGYRSQSAATFDDSVTDDSDNDSDYFMPRYYPRVRSGCIFGKDYGPRWARDVIDLGMAIADVINDMDPSEFPNYSRIADLGPESDLEECFQQFQSHTIHEVKQSDMGRLYRIIRKIRAIRRHVPDLMRSLLIPVIDETIERLRSFKKPSLREEGQATAGAQDEEMYLERATSLRIKAEQAPGNEGSREGSAGGIHLAAIVAEEY